MMALLQKLKKFMGDMCFTYTDEWLCACIEWVKENYPNPTEETFKKELKDQWMDTNLQVMASVCLPRNLAAENCFILKGKYGLQMNSIEDIGESAYSQWKSIKKLENENVSVSAAPAADNQWAPKPRQCLYMTLTDGSQIVYGLELTSIAALSLKLPAGVKVLLTGPIECRRGVLQLRPSNVKVLGGEVEEFRGKYSVDALLAQRLNLPADQINSQSASQSRDTFNPVPSAGVSNSVECIPTTNDGYPDGFSDDDDLFTTIDENMMIETIACAPPTPTPIKTASAPYIYIKQILENMDFIAQERKIVFVKACVVTVISNIAIENEAWSLTLSINDGTGFLNCKMCPLLLKNIIGFDPSEMKSLKNQKSPGAKQRIQQGMQELSTKLVHLNAILGINFTNGPVIVNFSDLNLQHGNAVKKRVLLLQ